jgi:rare lipoprotein A
VAEQGCIYAWLWNLRSRRRELTLEPPEKFALPPLCVVSNSRLSAFRQHATYLGASFLSHSTDTGSRFTHIVNSNEAIQIRLEKTSELIVRVHLQLLAAVILVSSAATVPSYAKSNHHHYHHHVGNTHSSSHNTIQNQGGGVASVYSTDSGSRTAQGGRLNPGALTAAHRSLPFGTKVRVTNKRNGRSVVVTINDRGPFVRGRVIDLTPASAHALGFAGLATVNLEVIR